MGIKRETLGGPYWVRTSDLFRVKEARYHCANGPEVGTGFEPVWTALQAAAYPLGQPTLALRNPVSLPARQDRKPEVKRMTGLEPAPSPGNPMKTLPTEDTRDQTIPFFSEAVTAWLRPRTLLPTPTARQINSAEILISLAHAPRAQW